MRLLALLMTVAATMASMDALAAVGRTPGTFAVSAVGSAQYTIPIWAPPGPRGMQPQVRLFYDSQAGIGPLGVGWSLGGLGQIARCNQTVAQDGTAAAVAMTSSDVYCINGNRLRLTSTTPGYGADGSTYQTEIADFSSITAHGSLGNGPAYFTVQARNGLTYQYGYTDSNGNGANSQAKLTVGSTQSVYTWLLSKVTDRAGNNWVINYTPNPDNTPATQLTGTAVPNKILWTPTSAGASTYAYTMQFNYGTNMPQSSLHAYVAGALVSNPTLLSSIEIFSGTTLVKDYFLGYSASPLTDREELTLVTECADAAKTNCLSPTAISYQQGSPGLSTVQNTAVSSSGALLTTRYDLNGDGIPDLVYDGGTTMYVAFGSASGFGTPIDTTIPAGVLIGNLTGGVEDGILGVSGGVWVYYTWNGSSFTGTTTGIAVDSTSYGYELADIDGDGLPDLVTVNVTTTVLCSKNCTNLAPAGGGSVTTSTATVNTRLNTSVGGVPSFNSTELVAYNVGPIAGIQLQSPDQQYGKMRRYDFNGDGRDDLVLEVVTGTSPSYTMTVYQLLSTTTQATAGFTASTIESAAASIFQPVFFTNWNDDKCTDFVTSNTLYVSGCDGTSPETYPLTGTVIGAIDWDGNKRTDLLVANGSTIGVYLSKATGAPTLTSTSIPYSSNCQYVWMDANSDGLDDLGCWSQAGTNPITYYLHNGTADLAASFVDGFGNSVSPSFVSIAQNNYTENPYWASPPLPTFPDKLYSGPMMVTSQVVFSDPSASSSTYTQSFWYYDAWQNLQGRGFEGFWVVRTNDSRYAALTPVLNHYEYYELQFPWTGMKYQDIVNAPTFYPSQMVATPNTLAQATLSSVAGKQRYYPYFASSVTKRSEVGGSEGTVQIATAVSNDTYDNYGNLTARTTIVTDTDPASPYNGATWTTTTTNTTDIAGNQAADLAAWCLNLVDETQVAYSSTLAGSTAVTRTKTFTPDTPAACRIKTAVTEPTANSGLYKVTEALTFDAFGNVATDTVTGANMPNSPKSRTTSLNWGTTGQFLTTATDASSATTSWTYGSAQSLGFGVPDSVKDPNNLTTSWSYDDFGRKNQETRPDGTSTAWTWSACAPHCGWSNSVYQIAQTLYQTNGTTAIRTDTTAYDPVDRVTQTAGPTVTGGISTVQTLYNSLGLIAQQSLPFLSGTPYQLSFSYDSLNRLVEAERPVNASGPSYCNPATLPPVSGCQGTSYSYTGDRISVTDPVGHTKTTVRDSNGWLRQTQDALGYRITRAFDAAGSLTGVTDNVGNTLLSGVSYAYGIRPFRLAATDADRGAWTYTVDSLGERIGWTDAKGQSFSMTYDALSRPVSRSEPDLFTQWTYGSSPTADNVGQLIGECSATGSPVPTTCGSTPQYSETRTFDAKGRLSTRAITENGNPGNDPGSVFLFTTAYSTTTGLPSSLTYPISTPAVGSNPAYALVLNYAYQNGLLQSVTDATDAQATCGSTCTLWTANAMNGFGEITQETLGNGVVTNRSFDAVTSWLSKATAGVGGGASLLNQSYTQDLDGNVMERQDNNQGLTENFFYDADERLTCATLTSGCTTPTFVYDGGAAGPGNITTQTGVGTYTYPAAGSARPHAVTSLSGTLNGISNPSFVYDANGNMTNRASSTQNVTWSSYNYPTVISASDITGTEEVQLFYGPDRQRWQQIYTLPGSPTEKTFYIGGLMDLVFSNSTTDYRHYIYAGTEPIAVYSRTAAGGVTMRYMFEDHQGGVSAIASASGGVDVNESFSAFGARRNPATWVGAPSAADLNTIAGLSRQGYTMQTWLGQSMGLNHMNGRVQDAILGRFLSPDPHVPDPSNAQSYNRYSYVNNNPLTNVDPSGFAECALNVQGPSQQFCTGTPINAIVGPPSADGSATYPGQSTDTLNNFIDSIDSQLDGWLNSQTLTASTSSNDDLSGSSLSAAYYSDSSMSQSAQSTDSESTGSQGGCVGSPCLDEVTVQASRSSFSGQMYQLGNTQVGNVSCGGLLCSYNATPYLWNGILAGVEFRLKYPGKPGFWVQTYQNFGPSVDGTVGTGISTPDCGPCVNDFTNGNMYWDQPGGQSLFMATTTLVQLNSSLNATPAFTIQWGFQATLGGGLNGVRFISPVPVAPSLLGWEP
jgi:RHS repeat-associated protein